MVKLRDTTEFLESIANGQTRLDDVDPEFRKTFHRAIARVHNPDIGELRRLAKAAERERSLARARRLDDSLHETGIRALRRKPVFSTPNIFVPRTIDPRRLEPPVHVPDDRDPQEPEPHHCYICKKHYSEVHHFYDQICPPCAEFNYAKRFELADLTGRVALLTGGRVKIGYQAGIKLLRAGATLIVTTRFPRDSAQRYSREPDFAEWGHRLQIYGLDLRHTPSVEAFCKRMLETLPRLDFIVNNACQTVRRPPEFYKHMMEGEVAALRELPPDAARLLGAYEDLRHSPAALQTLESAVPTQGITHAAELSQIALLAEDVDTYGAKHLFPEGRLDQDLQQVDLRGRMPASLGQGTLSLSRNGRWAVLTARDYGSIYPWPNSQLLDLESGTTVWIPFPVYAPVVVASDGTIAQPNHFGAGVWKPNEYLPLPLAPQGPGGPVGISDNSRVVVAFDWWETGSQRFVAIELKTGTKTTLDWPTDPKIFVSFHGISNDGTWVLSSRSDQPGRARIQNSGTAEFQEIRIPGDEAIREAVLSGYGNRAFFVTASRRILVVELAEGRATDVRILCECGG